jgi:hypothetical protein
VGPGSKLPSIPRDAGANLGVLHTSYTALTGFFVSSIQSYRRNISGSPAGQRRNTVDCENRRSRGPPSTLIGCKFDKTGQSKTKTFFPWAVGINLLPASFDGNIGRPASAVDDLRMSPQSVWFHVLSAL